MKTRNNITEQYKQETYKHGLIRAWKEIWEEYDEGCTFSFISAKK